MICANLPCTEDVLVFFTETTDMSGTTTHLCQACVTLDENAGEAFFLK